MAYNLNSKNNILKSGNERVTSDYGNRTITVNGKTSSGFHGGIDIISAKYGTDYLIAFEAGTIADTRNTITGYSETYASGNYVYIDHGNGFQTRYCHMKKDTLCVKKGDKVSKGQVIGFMNSSGFSSGNHVHFEVRKNGATENPKDYLLGTKTMSQAAAPTPAPSTPGSSEIVHTVVAGDTLWAIAKKYLGDGSRYPEIAKYNNIANPNVIFNGQKIKIPGKPTPQTANKYIVKKGDTLSGIAARYNTTWQALYEKNKKVIGSNPNLIKPGQELII